MCNSYEARSNYQEFVEAFSDTLLPLKFPPASAAPNLPDQPLVRPTDEAPIIREREGAGELVRIWWGFAPFKPKMGPIINFRSDGRNFRKGRCLAPASAFFEYTGEKYPKTRWRVSMSGEPWFAIAGVLRSAQGDWPESYSLLTCPPGPDIEPYHNRQMVVLKRGDFARWLDPATSDEDLASLMQPAPAGTLAIEKA